MDDQNKSAEELFEEYCDFLESEIDFDSSFIFYGGGIDYTDYGDIYPRAGRD